MSAAEWWAEEGHEGAAPLYATRRDPAYRTEGRRIGLVARSLGTPLMPWQQYVADVATELTPEGTAYRYGVVVVSVPRQSGKTTLMRAVGVDRCISRPDCGVFYTAQTGQDARARWTDLVKAITAPTSPLAAAVVVRRSAGRETVEFANGSGFQVFAPYGKRLHGYTPPLVMLDESFAHDQVTGDDLMGAIGPAQATIPHRQLWIVSTAGTAESVFLRRWVDKGRAGAPGVALFEWAAGDDVRDVYDPAVWPTFHPAMHNGLVTADTIREEAERQTRADFERMYANRWTRTTSHLIPADAWDRLAAEARQELPSSGVVTFGLDVMHDRSASALVATWRDLADDLQAKVVRTGQGMGWLADAVRTLHASGWREFACLDDGPAREVADELARDHVSVHQLRSRDATDAWGFLMQHVAHATLTHDGSDALAVAAANVATRPRQDGSAPSRRHSAGDVTPIVGLMAAAWWLDHRPQSGGLDYGFSGGAA